MERNRGNERGWRETEEEGRDEAKDGIREGSVNPGTPPHHMQQSCRSINFRYECFMDVNAPAQIITAPAQPPATELVVYTALILLMHKFNFFVSIERVIQKKVYCDLDHIEQASEISKITLSIIDTFFK